MVVRPAARPGGRVVRPPPSSSRAPIGARPPAPPRATRARRAHLPTITLPTITLPTITLPTQAAVEAMTPLERWELFLHLGDLIQQITAVQGMVAALLDVYGSEPLWTAQQTADVLNVHPDTVRDRGAEWGIEADLGEGVRRYIPEQVRALRARRKRAQDARLGGGG